MKSMIRCLLVCMVSSACGTDRIDHRGDQMDAKGGSPDDSEFNIINGDLDNGSPFVGALVDSDGDYCTGTLIAKDYILSAAHCEHFFSFRTDADVANGPFPSTSSPCRTKSGQAIGNCFEVSRDWKRNDLALVKLRTSAGNSFARIKLDMPRVGDPITTIGYGLSRINYPGSSGKRRSGGSVVHAVDRTASFDGSTYSETFLAIVDGAGKVTAPGDSGGPAMIGNEVAGTLWGGSFAPAGVPLSQFNTEDYYQSVPAAASWIVARMFEGSFKNKTLVHYDARQNIPQGRFDNTFDVNDPDALVYLNLVNSGLNDKASARIDFDLVHSIDIPGYLLRTGRISVQFSLSAYDAGANPIKLSDGSDITRPIVIQANGTLPVHIDTAPFSLSTSRIRVNEVIKWESNDGKATGVLRYSFSLPTKKPPLDVRLSITPASATIVSGGEISYSAEPANRGVFPAGTSINWTLESGAEGFLRPFGAIARYVSMPGMIGDKTYTIRVSAMNPNFDPPIIGSASATVTVRGGPRPTMPTITTTTLPRPPQPTVPPTTTTTRPRPPQPPLPTIPAVTVPVAPPPTTATFKTSH